MAGKARTVARRPRPALNQQTVRQIVHTSIGGSAARIQSSNVFGTQSVMIADAQELDLIQTEPPVCPSTRDRGAS
jgi:hypothetical protein